MTQNKVLQALPIDIHYNKLLDWLVNRRHCTQQCQAYLTVIRDKGRKALEASQKDGHTDAKIQEILKSEVSDLNYHLVKEIFELLKGTEYGKTNLIGQYSYQSMKNWAEIIKLYEKDNTFLAEAAINMSRNVNYEVPALKKQISKCQQTQKDCTRKENEFSANAADLRKQYTASCKQIGIEGEKIKTELAALVADLPQELNRLADSSKSLQDAVQYYTDFSSFVIKNETLPPENLGVLRHILSKGNTTTFEWRTGRVPIKVEDKKVSIDLMDEQDKVESSDAVQDIDWGVSDAGAGEIDFGNEIDFDIGDITVESGGVLSSNGEAHLEYPDIDEIDWCIVDNTTLEDAGAGDKKDDVAVGKDALSVIDNPDTRNVFINDLMELQAFFAQRVSELSISGGDDSHMASAPSDLHLDLKEVTAMLDKVNTILEKLTSVQMEHLLLIKDSPVYVNRLRDSLRQKLVLADKMILSMKSMSSTRQEASEEEAELHPLVAALKKQTKVIQKHLEVEIAKKYTDRKVNVIGEINTM